MYKVIVAGSRKFNDYALLKEELLLFLNGKEVKTANKKLYKSIKNY